MAAPGGELKCPVDGTALAPASKEAGAGLYCWKCRGLWFPYRSVVLKLGLVEKPTPRDPATASPLRCPQDGAALLLCQHRRGPEINVCARCAGVWLDEGEYEKIVAPLPKPVYSQAAQPGQAGASGLAPSSSQAVSAPFVPGEPELELEEPSEPDAEPWREEMRESLEHPKLRMLLVLPLMLIGVPVLIGLASALGEKVGQAAVIIAAVAIGAGVLLGQRRGITLEAIEEVVREHEDTLHLPQLARFLTLAETVVATIALVVFAPVIGAQLAGDDHGELGFGGVIFIVMGFWVGATLAGMYLWFTSSYLQDRYLLRGLVDVAALVMLAHVALSLQNAPVPKGETSLYAAVREGDAVRVEKMLKRNDDQSMRNELGETPFAVAVQQAAANPAKLPLVTLLLDKGAQIGAKDAAGRSPLMAALLESQRTPAAYDVVSLLLERGAGANDFDGTGTPALLMTHDPRLMILLIDRGADANFSGPSCGSIWSRLANQDAYTIIDVADRIPQISVPHALGSATPGGIGPLYVAADARDPADRVRLIRYFLGRGVSAKDRNGCDPSTPLHALMGKGGTQERIQAIDLLLDAGADINARVDNRTPLMGSGENPEVMRHLIARGANINVMVGQPWKSTLDIVEAAGHTEAAALLRASGAKRGHEVTSPEQRRLVEKLIDEGPQNALQSCTLFDNQCGMVVAEEYAQGIYEKRIRRTFRRGGLELRALYSSGETRHVVIEEVSISGPEWSGPLDLRVGSERKDVERALGMPNATAEGCGTYHTSRIVEEFRYSQMRFCYGGELHDRVERVQWRTAPEKRAPPG